MRRLGLIPRLPTILAPRGEYLSAGALGLKHARKQAYLLAARGLGLLDDVWLHATSEQEADEIRDGCPWARDIVVAPNIRVLGPMPQAAAPADDGRLRIVFLSRVNQKEEPRLRHQTFGACARAGDVRYFWPGQRPRLLGGM